MDAVGTTDRPEPDRPNNKITRAEFLRIVKTGVPDKGMQAWDKLLDDKQIGDLYVYVRARADKVLPPGRPDEVGPNGGLWAPLPAGCALDRGASTADAESAHAWSNGPERSGGAHVHEEDESCAGLPLRRRR